MVVYRQHDEMVKAAAGDGLFGWELHDLSKSLTRTFSRSQDRMLR